MKISSNPDAAAQAQSLLPIPSTSKIGSGKSPSLVARGADPTQSIDPADPQSFSKLLDTDRSDPGSPRGAKGSDASSSGASVRQGSSRTSGARSVTRSGAGQEVRRSATAPGAAASTGNSGDVSASLAESGPSSSQTDCASPSPGDAKDAQPVSLTADTESLPPDPRLQQDPAELALDAAALAAAQLLASACAVVNSVSTPTPIAASDETAQPQNAVVGDATTGSDSGASDAGDVVDQLALRTLQASFRSSLLSAQSAQVIQGAQSSPGTRTELIVGGSDEGLLLGSLPAGPVGSSPSVLSPSSPEAFVSVSSVGSFESALPLDVPLISVSASASQAAALSTLGQKGLAAINQVASVSQPASEPAAGPTLPAPSEPAATQSPASSDATDLSRASDPRQEAFFAPVSVVVNQVQSGKSERSVLPKGPETAAPSSPASQVAVALPSDASGNGASDARSDAGTKDQRAPSRGVEVQARTSMGNTTPANVLDPKALTEAGTLGATSGTVSKNDSTVRTQLESAPAVSLDTPVVRVLDDQASDSGAAPNALNAILAPHSAKPLSEVSSKPVVLPAVQVRANEVWKVVSDALQRARSENPSHLAVEVRMEDGSTLGLEVRMSSSGLQASFRSESQTLLKTLETQWAAFLAKEPSDTKIASAVFEGRTNFGTSTDSSGNGGERRQQLEDASASAALSRGVSSGKSPADVSDPSAPKQITPLIRTRDGRVSVYA